VQALAALADPGQRQIVEMLADRERDAGEVAAAFPVSRPAVSRHLRVLREAGLVRAAGGAATDLCPGPAAAGGPVRWLERYRGFWDQRLDALEVEVVLGRRQPERR
jgi:DNA-binding transcriptional ArsR family regulator